MERNLSKPWDPHHIPTWVPIFTPANLRTWRTLYLYPGNREGQLGVQNCQQLAGTLKVGRYLRELGMPPLTLQEEGLTKGTS